MKKILLLFSIIPHLVVAQPTINTHDIYTGTYSGNPTNLYVYDNALYFFANEGTYGHELWKLDAVSQPQRQLNIGPGAGDGHTPWKFYQMAGSNGTLYMTAKDGTYGLELWRYDGLGSPKMIKDIYSGPGGSLPTYMTPLGENIYFSAKDSLNWELWRYNAVKDSTEKVGGNATGHNPGFLYYITEYKGKLYFHGRTDSFGRELYYYDPTINHIGIVADIEPTDTATGAFGPRNLIVIDNYLYFTAKTVQYGRELYRYDGTNPPLRVTDINPNNRDGIK